MLRELLVGVILTGAASAGVFADEQSDKLLKLLPPSTNVVAVVHADQVLGSPRGIEEDWAGKQQDRFLAGATPIPPNVTTLVQGMHVRPDASSLISTTTIMPLPQRFDLWAFADREKDASVDQIAGVSAVQARQNCLYVELPGPLLAILTPAARQEAARYIRSVPAATQSALIDSYLTRTARLPHQIVFAIDLQDVARPDHLRDEVAALEGAKGNAVVQKELLELLGSLQGVRFCADVQKSTTAVLAADFGKPASDRALLLKPLMLRIVSDAGMHVGELDTASAKINGNSLELRMNAFSDTSLRMVLSMITVSSPSSAPIASRATESPASTSSAIDGKASKRYFQMISQSLDDLDTSTNRNRNLGQGATWYDNMARKIDKMPSRGVDPELIEYGAATSRSLKGLAASLKGVAMEVQTVGKTLVWKSNYDPGYAEVNIWGGVGYRAPTVNVDSNLQQVREQQAAAVLRGEKDREKVWQMILDERDQMRGKVQVKYGRDL